MANVILVPLNGSADAEQALPIAIELAAGGGRIVLARAVLAHTGVTDDLAAARRWGVDQAAAYLYAVAARLGEQRVPVETVVVQGPPAIAILAAVDTQRPDLVVMVTYGRSEGGQWTFGSMAEALLRHSSAPVCLLRATPAERPRPRGALRRILLPLDGSVAAEATLPIAGRLAGQFGAALILMRVLPSPSAPSTNATRPTGSCSQETLERSSAQADDYLRAVRHRLSIDYPGVVTRIESRLGAPAAAILAAGHDDRVDLIIMTTRCRDSAERVVLGSVAVGVLRGTTLPLLLVNPC